MKLKRKDVPHPGEILRKEYLEKTGLSANALALALHVPATRISEILRGRRSISADTALRLEYYFGHAKQGRSASEWMLLQSRYDLFVEMRASSARIDLEVKPLSRRGRRVA
jgi:addiction module HigA family antidote